MQCRGPSAGGGVWHAHIGIPSSYRLLGPMRDLNYHPATLHYQLPFQDVAGPQAQLPSNPDGDGSPEGFGGVCHHEFGTFGHGDVTVLVDKSMAYRRYILLKWHIYHGLPNPCTWGTVQRVHQTLPHPEIPYTTPQPDNPGYNDTLPPVSGRARRPATPGRRRGRHIPVRILFHPPRYVQLPGHGIWRPCSARLPCTCSLAVPSAPVHLPAPSMTAARRRNAGSGVLDVAQPSECTDIPVR